MYGRLSVFLSLFIFASAVPIHLRWIEIENVPVFVVDDIAAEEGAFSTLDHLPTPPPMPEHRSKGSRKQVLGVLRSGTKSIDFGPTKFWQSDGDYYYDFEIADGIEVSKSGSQKQVGPRPEEIGTFSKGSYSINKGSYSFNNPDGVVLTVNQVADENGFQATGDHLRTPPPMPALYDFETGNVLFKSASGTNLLKSGSKERVGGRTANTAGESISYTAPDGAVITLTNVA